MDIKIILNAKWNKLIPELAKSEHPLHQLWEKVKDVGLVDGACHACSNKMGVLKDAESQGLNLLDDMSGHPGMAGYRLAGYEIISF